MISLIAWSALSANFLQVMDDNDDDEDGQGEGILVLSTSIYQDHAHHFLTSLLEAEAIDEEIPLSPTMNYSDLHVGMQLRGKHTLRLVMKLYYI